VVRPLTSVERSCAGKAGEAERANRREWSACCLERRERKERRDVGERDNNVLVYISTPASTSTMLGKINFLYLNGQ